MDKQATKKNYSIPSILFGVLGLIMAGVMLFMTYQTFSSQQAQEFDRMGIYDKYYKMNVVLLSEPFAQQESKGASLYFAIDGTMTINVVALDEETAATLDSVKNANIQDTDALKNVTPVTVYGRPQVIEANLRHTVVDAFNQMMGTEDMNYGKSVNSIGLVYLDTTLAPALKNPWPFLILGVAILALSLYFIILGIVQIRSRRSRGGVTTKEDPRVQELDVRVGYEPQSCAALTATAVVDLKDEEFSLVPFEDVLWLYSVRSKRGLGGSSQTVVLGLKGGERHELAPLSSSGSNNQIFLELFSDIKDRVPQALVGYTRENEEKFLAQVERLKEESDKAPEEPEAAPVAPDFTGNKITGVWHEGEDILPPDWDGGEQDK